MTDIRIIPALEEHVAIACDIAIKAWIPIREVFRRDLGDELYDVFFADWQAEKRASAERILRTERAYVAVLDGTVVGFVSYRILEGTKCGVVSLNAVDPEYRGMGIAPQMYNFVLEKMREEGMLYAKVHTGLDDGHIPARRAYQKVGFEKNLPSVDYYMKL